MRLKRGVLCRKFLTTRYLRIDNINLCNYGFDFIDIRYDDVAFGGNAV